MEENPGLIIFIMAIVVIAMVTTWAQDGGFNHLLAEGGKGSLFSITPPFVNSPNQPTLQNYTYSLNGEERPVAGANQIVRGEEVYTKSNYYGRVSIGLGTAGSVTQPNDEYITLNTFNLREPVNITGWYFKNGKDLKLFKVSGDLVRYRSDLAAIGRGTRLFDKNGNGVAEDIYLKPGDRVVVVTGRPYGIAGVPVNFNFKTNICTGYLENLPYSNFKPSLPLECPLPSQELGLSYLEEDCYRYLKSVPRCFTPEFEAVYRVGNDEYRDVVKNGPLTLSSQCKTLLRDNFNYQACLDVHSRDTNFEGKEWRVFLNRPTPLYDRSREVITLFDREGRVVDQISY
jgi:hypothetical protein